jgi:hypothetical protein
MSVTSKAELTARVILLRRVAPAGFEVLLTPSPGQTPLPGGSIHCFPGGPVRKEDCRDDMLGRCRGLTAKTARAILGAHHSPRQALGLWIAAVRELFEKIGLLLATDENGRRIAIDRERATGLAAKRSALADGTLSFASILQNENLFCDAGRLAYFSQWQTLAEDSEPSDTRFFLAEAPSGYTPVALPEEAAASRWLTPDAALELFRQGEASMIVSTFASLRTLADFGSIENVLAEYAAERESRKSRFSSF